MSNRNTCDLRHTVKMTGKMGILMPLGCFEVLPGDHFKCKDVLDIRFQALLRPVMHNIRYTVHFWFVPTRLLWDEWENFITGGEDGTAHPVAPYITTNGTNNAEGTLLDYLGVPTGVSGLDVSALPVRAYNLIFNEWYRNQNVRQKYAMSKGSGADNTTDLNLKRRCWKPNDYFTNALPFLQRGDMVSMPMEGFIPVKTGDGAHMGEVSEYPVQYKVLDGTTLADGHHTLAIQKNGAGDLHSVAGKLTTSPAEGTAPVTPHNLIADLKATTYGFLVSTFRQGFGVQHLLEKFARSGARMVEVITSAWKIRSSDARLQRPEFLGGGSRPIVISQVLQTSATENDSTPQANPAGYAQALSISPSFNKAFEEWGYVIPILSVVPEADYMQGLARMWTRKTRFDYAWPDLARIGDQAILNREIYADGSDDDSDVFGYAPRYEEYRRLPNRVCGQFRSTLDFWHLARKFANTPVLSAEFCECNPDEQRIFAVEGEDNLLIECFHELFVTRSLPRLGTPGLSYV